ncbi:hypothetical protein WDZ17_12940 [Pseudokineococcus basanitobsidens]|uniref:Uncharacterized protein n=1 Tax=Pseudokineococcus basanitobsidens TaxID=1926649 RepID=A0ABU8RME8_9ACTN
MTADADASEPSGRTTDASSGQLAASGRPRRRDDESPVLPDRAGEDRPEAWGERPDPEDLDDERYLRERPPHW